MKISAELIKKIAPTGKLRASINLGNPILANRDPITGEPVGVSIDLVKQDSALKANDEVDVLGNRVVVGKGSAYDLYLSREIKHAEIVRAPTSPTVVELFMELQCEVAAGVRQQLEADSKRFAGLRLLPGRFMVIQQAMGLPLGRGTDAATFLGQFVEAMKSSGFVEKALQRHQIKGASVAPAVGS